jgi:hypothetical protein
MQASRSAIWWMRAKPWLALLGLIVLFELPESVLLEWVRPAADLFVLLGLYLLSLRVAGWSGRAMRWGLLLYTVLLVFYRVDRAAILAFMGQEPLLYDQILMLRHLFVLFSDLWSWQLGVGLAAFPLAVALIVWVATKLLRALRPLAFEPRQSIAALVVIALGCASTALGDGQPIVGEHMPHWISPALVANLETSHAIYSSVRQQLRNSPYRAFDAVKLRRRPDVYLIFVESYGRVMMEHHFMRPAWRKRADAMQRGLATAGWHSASAFTVAPVAGGRSWLAEASVLTGIKVDYEAVFHHLIGQIERVPNLVSLLQNQGYNTILLAPADRVRKGVEEANYYNYHRVVRFNDLHYRGPKMGWGIVPDQYSLYHTQENVLRSAQRPLFFNYHMVSSHTPFEPVPELVDDWRSLGGAPSDPSPVDDSKRNALGMRMKRYAYSQPRFMPMGKLRTQMARNYADTIVYDLELLQRFLEQLSGDALVIVMGDHQPPFVAKETESFDAPIHLFARDPGLLAEFLANGFKPGLMLGRKDPSAIHHQGLFSLIVRNLARCCGSPSGGVLPTYRAQGTQF